MPHTTARVRLILVFLILQFPVNLFSEEKDPIKEVVVTADPGESSLEALPGSATVMYGEALSQPGGEHIQNILDNLPNVSTAGGTSRPRFFQIRGIGELEQYQGAPNPSVGYIVDDLDLSGLGASGSLFDVDQIEVLRGPQGLGYGSSALAGLINIRSAEPTTYTTSRGEFSLGGDGLREFGAALSGPIEGSDGKLLLRLSAFGHQSDGFRRNVFLMRNDTNDRDEFTGRIKVRWLPSKDLTVDFTGIRVEQDNGYDAFAIDNSFTTQSDDPGEDRTLLNGGVLKETYEISRDTKIVNITSLSHFGAEYSYDGDWGNNPFWEPFAPYDYFSDTIRNRSTFEEELKVISDPKNSLRWLGGISFLRLSETSDDTQLSDGIPYATLQSRYRQLRTSAYGRIEAPVAEKTSFLTGLRVEHHGDEYEDSNDKNFDPDKTLLGGAVSLTHELNPTNRTYVTLSRGFKGGGFNAGLDVPDGKQKYDPEYLYNLEAGIKSNWLDNRLNATFDVFGGERRDQQAKLALQNNPNDPLAFTYVTDNAAKGRLYGMETEIKWNIVPEAEVYATGGLLKSYFTEYQSPDGRSLDGRDASHAPNWMYSVGTRYRFTENLYAKVSSGGRDRFYFDDSHDQISHSYSLVNGEVGYREERWGVSVWARNIFDKRYAVRGFFFGNEPPDFASKLYVQQGDPFSFGATLAVYF